MNDDAQQSSPQVFYLVRSIRKFLLFVDTNFGNQVFTIPPYFVLVGGMVAGATLAAMSGRLTKMQR